MERFDSSVCPYLNMFVLFDLVVVIVCVSMTFGKTNRETTSKGFRPQTVITVEPVFNAPMFYT